MRRVLLDEGVPVGIRKNIKGFVVETVSERGWSGLTNGLLIEAAEQAEFSIMVTADQNIRYQQNMQGRLLALIVVETNHWATLRAHPTLIQAALDHAQPGTFVSVAFPRPPLRRRPKPMPDP
jgi:hypothetical protein